MARTAHGKKHSRHSSSPLSSVTNHFQTWIKSHPEEIRVGGCVALLVFFFTQGLPLFDDDYSQWLAQANGSFVDLVGRLILPFTSEPSTWGYSDRPVQVLLYKVLHLAFGYWGTGYFFVKSLVSGALAGTLFHWMKKLGVDRKVAYLSIALFAFSTNVLASVIWHSDFGVYSQLVMALILLWALPQIEKGPSNVTVYKKGWSGLPKPFANFLLTFLAFVYFGSKLRGDVRLVPVILATYLYFFDKNRFKVFAGPFAVAFLATLPWSKAFFSHLPPFIPGAAGYQGATFGAFSLTRVFEFLAGDLFSFQTASLSVLGGVGILATLGALAYGIHRAYEERLEAPDHKWGFFMVWFGVALLACGILAPQSQAFQLRLTLMLIVPGTILFSLILNSAQREFGKTEWFEGVVIAVVTLQCGFHFYHSYHHRRDMGHTMVSVDKIYQTVELKHADGQLLLSPGYLAYGYKASTLPVLANRKSIGSMDEASKFPLGNTYVASWDPTLDARMTVDQVASGCNGAVFDLIAPCANAEGAVLMRYLGDVAEVTQAGNLDRQGNLNGARQILESYLTRDPGNLGAAFVLGLYHYRASDFAKMEQVYDQIGPYFPYHTAVMYNLGLAKQGMHKYPEASKYLERAYSMAPRDYGIGFNLADSYYKMGKKTRALATLDSLIQVYPNNTIMKETYKTWSQ